MKTTPAYKCICQDCSNVFNINETMVNVINLDEDDCLIQFLTASLNKISCPYCDADFTYEIPMLIYSQKSGFALRVNPSVPSAPPSPDVKLPYFFKIFNLKYRQVTYHIEALEKVRIFKDGFDDKYIEFVKFNFFSDDDCTPMEDINLCYKSSDNEKLYFEKLDYNGKLIKEYEVLKSDVRECSFIPEPCSPAWVQINRYTIENYINKEEISCQD